MNLTPTYHLPEILIIEVGDLIANFDDKVADLSPELNKDARSIITTMFPMLEWYYFSESAIGALAYQLWTKYPNIPAADMEVYSDAIVELGDVLEKRLYSKDCYNEGGMMIYAFERMLGNSAVIRLRQLKDEEYQMF